MKFGGQLLNVLRAGFGGEYRPSFRRPPRSSRSCGPRSGVYAWVWRTVTPLGWRRTIVTLVGHGPFFPSACHLGLDARFGVQDVPNLGEPPVESPALAPPAAGFFFGPRAKPGLGNFVKCCKLLS